MLTCINALQRTPKNADLFPDTEDSEVYSEMTDRVPSLGDSPVRRSLADNLEELGKRAKGLRAQPVQQPPSRPEGWLVDRLVHTADLDRRDVLAMTSEQAVDAWTAYITRQQ